MKDKFREPFDWAHAIYELAHDQSDTIDGILKAADLNPQAGDLADINLSQLDLSDQDLSGWDLSGANLADTIIRGTNLRGAKIEPRALLKARDWWQAELDDELRREATRLSKEPELEFNAALLKKVDELELSLKAVNGLLSDNLVYIGDLVQKTEPEMLRTPNFGRKALNEVKEVLAMMGLHFGMEIPNWPPENIEELAKRFEDQY